MPISIPTRVVSTRLSLRDDALLKALAASRQESVAVVVRTMLQEGIREFFARDREEFDA